MIDVKIKALMLDIFDLNSLVVTGSSPSWIESVMLSFKKNWVRPNSAKYRMLVMS